MFNYIILKSHDDCCFLIQVTNWFHYFIKSNLKLICLVLVTNTKYELRIQARNTHGRGGLTEEFLLVTRSTSNDIFLLGKKLDVI